MAQTACVIPLITLSNNTSIFNGCRAAERSSAAGWLGTPQESAPVREWTFSSVHNKQRPTDTLPPPGSAPCGAKR